MKAKRGLYKNLRKFGHGSKPTPTEKYTFIAACSGLYDTYGFIPAWYAREAAGLIDQSRMSKPEPVRADTQIKEVH